MSYKPPRKNPKNRYYTEFTPWGEKNTPYRDHSSKEPIWKSYTPENKRDKLYSRRERYIQMLRELDDEIEEEESYQEELDRKYQTEFSRDIKKKARSSPTPSFRFDFGQDTIPNKEDIVPRRSTPIKKPVFEDSKEKNTPDDSKITPGLFQFNFNETSIKSKKKDSSENRHENTKKDDIDKNKEDDFFGRNSSSESADTEGFIFQSGEKLKKPEPGTGLLQLLIQGSHIGESRTKEDKVAMEKFREKLKKRSLCLQGKSIPDTVDSLDDLISLADKIGDIYSLDETYVLDLSSLQKMAPSLRKLKKMIGLDDIKQQIVQQVLFYLQGLDEGNKDMLHTVIEGNPGVGKTEIAKILGEIYGALGILSKGGFHSVKRADLVGGYLGQTATKTLEALEKAKGGVLFIDEAYSLGNTEGKDMYSKECIDTITAYLSENREDFVCIIAGYKDALKKCFFKYNEGLERRFPWRYSIKSYSEEELKLIFEKIVQDHHWKCRVDIDFFKEHINKFKNSGGDLENLFQKSKLAHAQRCLSLPFVEKKIITMKDMENGLDNFIQEKEEKNTAYAFMYN